MEGGVMFSLFIDTHDTTVLLALYKDEKLVNKIEVNNSKAHSEITIPTLLSLLEQVDITINNISDIVVVNGPGSFTGERLGVTIAKTLAYSLNIPIRTITSLEMYLNGAVKQDEYIALSEKNGYFIGKIKNKQIMDYQYLTNQEYLDFKSKNKVLEPTKVYLKNIMKYAHQKNTLNPHEVNPFYVKKIEVEK